MPHPIETLTANLQAAFKLLEAEGHMTPMATRQLNAILAKHAPHNHLTRALKPKGECPACDRTWKADDREETDRGR